MEKRKHPKLNVKKAEILKPFRFPSTKFYPRNPISSGKFIKKMENIENNQIFKIKDVEEVVFIIEAFDQTPLNKIDKIIDENFKGNLLLFLSETEFLIRCKKESLDKIIEKYKNKELSKKFQESIKEIKTLNAYDKISNKLRKKLEVTQKKLEITGLLVPGFKKDEYTELIERLKKIFPESKISSSKFISSSLLTFNALGDIKSVENISQQPYIFLISEPPKIDIDFNKNLEPRQNKKTLVREDDKKPNVCIVDSGVDRNAIPGAVLIEDGHPTLHGDYTYSHTHGTEVSSIAALGDDLIFYGNAAPTDNSCNIISYKMADVRLPDPLFSCLYHAITKYKQKTRIFNLSVSYRFHDPLSHYLTNEIDRLVQNENIILVNSAGNIKLDQMEYTINRGNNYPFYLEDFVCQNPSNAKNVLAISSYALNESSLSICKKNEISPYSAIGRLPEIQDNRLKPNLFAVGGNVEKKNTSIQRNDNLGMPVISTGGLLEKRNGTSFSAPYSSYILSHLDKIYSPLNSETLKAILLSNCTISTDGKLKLFDNRENVCYSDSNRNILCYAENTIKLKRWDKIIKKYRCDKDSIRFYVPSQVKEIRIVILHSDNSIYSTNWKNTTQLKINIFKPGRNKKLLHRDAEEWHFDKQSQFQYAILKYKKAQTGDWYVTIEPEGFSIRSKEKEKIIIRYGIAINLILDIKYHPIVDPYDTILDKLGM